MYREMLTAASHVMRRMWRYQEGATDMRTDLARLDSVGCRSPQRRYVPDPCSGSRGGGDGERTRRSRRSSASVTAAHSDDADDEELYMQRAGRRRSSPTSINDEVMSETSSDSVIIDFGQQGDVLPGRTIANAPCTLPGLHPTRPYGTSSLSSGTGNSRVLRMCLFP